MNPVDVLEVKRALEGMAEILWHYRAQLLEQGFTEAEALAIVLGYQAVLLKGGAEST